MAAKLEDRLEHILETLHREGAAEVEPLSASLGVSTQTIRKDLAELTNRGLVARTHGGARLVKSVSNRSYQLRRTLMGPQKEAIAAAAAALIPDHCSVILNIGTTTEQVARALAGHQGLVVISNNVNVISAFYNSNVRDLRLIGGTVRQDDGAIVGEDAVEQISRYKADFAIIGASALDEEGSIMDYDGREVAVSRAILRNARTRILACDASKFERRAPVRICEVADLDQVVTAGDVPRAFLQAARRGNTAVTLADRGR